MGFHSVNMDLNTIQPFHFMVGSVRVSACRFFHLPFWEVLSMSVFFFVFYCSQLCVCVCLCSCILAGAAEDHSVRPVQALGSRLRANNTAAGPAGLPVCRPLCTTLPQLSPT